MLFAYGIPPASTANTAGRPRFPIGLTRPEAREHARQATELERKAAATREEAADLHAPAGAELDEIRSEQERARAEGRDELERRAVVAKADVEQRRAALAELLDDGQSVEEHVNGLDEQPRDETPIEQSIAPARGRGARTRGAPPAVGARGSR